MIVINSMGKIVRRKAMEQGQAHEVSLQDAAQGVYIVRVSNGRDILSARIVRN